MGWANLAQFINTITCRLCRGHGDWAVNALGKLGNALGDVAQQKEIDVSDAWQINLIR